MKSPKQIDKVSIETSNVSLGPYPPLGFIPMHDAELGNGDYYGLYWSLGREKEEPVVCDMLHDEWSLEPSFSTLDKFIEWLEINDWERGDEEITDDNFSPYLFYQAKSLLSGKDIEAAIEFLQRACHGFPDVSEYWETLSSQFRRVGKAEESANAALKAFNANWVFGLPSESIMRSLRNPKTKEILNSDPVIKRIDDISLGFGGVHENSTYTIIAECVEEYFVKEQYIEGLSLNQNYAYIMYSETVSFQERNKFILEDWQSEFSQLCLKFLGDNRREVG